MSQPDKTEDQIVEQIKDAAEAVGFRIASDVEMAAIVEAAERAKLERDDEARAAGQRFLDEERDRDVVDGWYAEAEKMTLAVLPAFLEGLATAYRHDYGTICHAVASAALAAAHAVDNSPAGGITGFQAGAIMWEFVRHWDHLDGPARMVKYENMLYPQYADSFGTISAESWAWVQAEAQKKLNETEAIEGHWLHDHWRSIVAGEIPFGLRLAS